MALAISAGGVVRHYSSTAVLEVHRCSGLVDVAPELFWVCTEEVLPYIQLALTSE